MKQALCCSCLVFVLMAAGCTTTHWGWRPLDQPTPVKPDDPVGFWSRGAVHTWHAVVFTQDSVSGIPYEMSLKCDSCRLRLPLAEVDSLKLGYRYHNVPKDILTVAGITTLALVVEAALCTLIGARNDC